MMYYGIVKYLLLTCYYLKLTLKTTENQMQVVFHLHCFIGEFMEKHIEVERSIYKKYRKDIWKKFIAGINEYQLIKEGDCIAVCISGGKDSMLLAKCIQHLQKHSGHGR